MARRRIAVHVTSAYALRGEGCLQVYMQARNSRDWQGPDEKWNLRVACVSCNDKMATRNLYEFKHEGKNKNGARFEWRDAQRARERAWLESQKRHKSRLKKNKMCARSKEARKRAFFA